jgi:hypothetical protein
MHPSAGGGVFSVAHHKVLYKEDNFQLSRIGGEVHRQQVARLTDSKIWERVPWNLEPRMTVLVKASSNLPDQT